MACSTLSGITLDYCRDGRGGIEGLWVIDAAEGLSLGTITDGTIAVTDISVTTDETASALDATLTDMASYELYKELSNMSEAGTFEQTAGTGFQTATVNAVFLNMDGLIQAELNQLAKSRRLCVIVKDGYGKFWLVGNDRGAFISGSASESGTAWNDQNSTTITFTGISETSMLEVTNITL